VYYAKQFDALRRRCGVEEAFARSMARCEPWKAQGGKSRSNFWKTLDERFIIKTLINAWNVADLCVVNSSSLVLVSSFFF
jgi:1-phosphatidylinositol-3-phosphate 5-kinase